MMKLSRRTLVAAALAAAMIPQVQAADVPEVTLTSYGGNYENFFRKEVIPGFEAKYNIRVKLAVGLSKDWIAEIRASGHKKAPYDVIMMNEIWASQLRKEGFFQQLDPAVMPNLEKARFRFRDAGGKEVSVIGNIDPVGIAYRTDLVQDPPKSWEELWDPKYKGKLGLYTLVNSVGAMVVFTAAKMTTGDEHNYRAGIDKVFELKPFKLSDYSGDMEKLLTMGEVQVCANSAPSVYRLKNKGAPVDWIAPKEHLLMFEQVFSVHEASEVSKEAQTFINYILSPEIQEKFARIFFSTPGVAGVKIPDEVKQFVPIGPDDLDRIQLWDWAAFNKEKSKLVRYWNQNVNR